MELYYVYIGFGYFLTNFFHKIFLNKVQEVYNINIDKFAAKRWCYWITQKYKENAIDNDLIVSAM